MDKLSSGLTGIAGEYFVAAELSRRGFMASITLRNNDSIDIHASRLADDDKIFAIQVKTTQVKGRKWPLSAKAEKTVSKNHFYIFVYLNGCRNGPTFLLYQVKLWRRLSGNHINFGLVPLAERGSLTTTHP